MFGLNTRLRNKVELYGRTRITNELGEDGFQEGLIKRVWCEFTHKNGGVSVTSGETEKYNTTHKIIIRSNAVKDLSTDMFFVYQGVRYDIEYFNPSFKYNDFVEIFVKRVEGANL